ncbi:MAG: class II aldolase/adducin family protein [Chthoniobacterales bacterium]
MSETGSVKFTHEQDSADPISFRDLAALNRCRRQLLQLSLLGVDAAGIGFGNVSVRDPIGGFVITGSNTGALPELGAEQLSRVTAFNLDRNWLRCDGATIASSESLTHAAVYEADESVSAVIHCHSRPIWKALRNIAPTTSADIEYGTPAMAREVARLFTSSKVKESRLFIMAGHEDGVVSFGQNLEGAFAVLLRAMHNPSS